MLQLFGGHIFGEYSGAKERALPFIYQHLVAIVNEKNIACYHA